MSRKESNARKHEILKLAREVKKTRKNTVRRDDQTPACGYALKLVRKAQIALKRGLITFSEYQEETKIAKLLA